MWEHVDLAEIRVFLTLCEELHFGHTAERLQISQTRVTQLLQSLEAKLGARLLERTSRRVAITARGEQFRQLVTAPYGQLRDALRDTYQSAQGISGQLRLGLLFPSSGGHALAQIVSLFEARNPDCRVVVSDAHFDDPLGPLRRGEIDLLALRFPIDQPDLTVGPVLVRDERLLAVSATNPLAKEESVSVEEIADYESHDAGGRLPRSTSTPSSLPAPRPAARSAGVISPTPPRPGCSRSSPATRSCT